MQICFPPHFSGFRRHISTLFFLVFQSQLLPLWLFETNLFYFVVVVVVVVVVVAAAVADVVVLRA